MGIFNLAIARTRPVLGSPRTQTGTTMRIHFHGAAGQVTGSMHLVECAGKRVLLDCGMQQGSRRWRRRTRTISRSNWRRSTRWWSATPTSTTSAASRNWWARLPRPDLRPEATAELMPIMLLDAASLAEADAERQPQARPGRTEVRPLYTATTSRGDGAGALAALRHAHRHPPASGPGSAMPATSSARPSSSVGGREEAGVLRATSGRRARRSRATRRTREADLLLMESTHGDRNHRDRAGDDCGRTRGHSNRRGRRAATC